MKKLYLSLLFITSFISAQAQWGILDTSFGADGIVTSNLVTDDEVLSVAVQPDGKIVAAGFTKVGGVENFAVSRYNEDGTLDLSFGTNGIRAFGITGSPDLVQEVLIQPDGKIVLVGYSVFNQVAEQEDFFVLRLLANGDHDTTFGVNGYAHASVAEGGPDYGYDGVLQADGKIVVAGYVTNGSGGDFGLVRFKTNGTVDSTFGTNGIVLTDFNSGADICFNVNIQADGKIIASGYAYDVNSYKFGIARYNTNGTLDNSFDTDGKVMTQFGTNQDVISDGAIQADGKLVVAGHTYNAAMKTEFALARYNTNGSLDNTFGTGGKVTATIDTNGHWGRAVVVQPDGKIIIAGQASIGNNLIHHFALIRFNTNGTLDNTFGTGGKVLTAIGTDYAAAQTMALQGNNKVVVAGTAAFNSQMDFALARYLIGPTLGVLNFTKGQTELLIYPNPIQSVTTLEYTLEQDENISITIKDVQGRTVQTVASGQLQAKGIHKLPLSLSPSLPAGNYFVILASATGSTAIQVTK